ncbi:MAG: Dyp-type peroxidase [Myxococcales bacterium]|nr:MAG: Dyp-type peroxidase [Myxococcales bacterium]
MAELTLEDIQANLLRGHKLKHVLHLFGEVRAEDAAGVEDWRAFLGRLGSRITRASAWQQGASVTINVGLSFAAVSALRPTLARELEASFDAFREGMPRRAELLGDSDFKREVWERRNVWVSISAQTEADLNRARDEVEALAENGALLTDYLEGEAIEKDGHWHEHFGFRDDISFPAFEGIPGLTPAEIKGRGKLQNGSWTALAAGEFVLGEPNESGENALEGLTEDAQVLLRNGSFAVFRHLQQHVEAFHEYAQRMRGAEDADFVAERMMGRTKQGDPLVPTDEPPGSPDQSNFNYESDPKGAQCPMGSHVRRMNPRDGDGRHRLIRRSVPFGKPALAGQPAAGPVGLLFVAFNADIKDQFEHVQRDWCNATLSNAVPNARDPIGSAMQLRSMVVEGSPARGRRAQLLLKIPQFVTCLGGQYYLYPGLAGLELLAAGPARNASQRVLAAVG